MTSFNDREKAYENRYAHDEEIRFKIASRRRKLLGLWVAEKIGLSDTDSLNYAMELVLYGIDDTTPGAVINKIVTDSVVKGKALAETEVRKKNNELEVIATRQIIESK